MNLRRGFTLVELLIVVAIVGILVAVSAFGVKAFLDAARMNEAVAILESRTAEGRRLAKRLDQAVDLELELDDGKWGVVLNGQRTDLPGVTVPSGETTLTFDPPYGTYGGSEEVVQIKVGNRTAEVVITGILARTVVNR